MTNFLQSNWLGDMQFSGNMMQKRGTSLQKIANSLQKGNNFKPYFRPICSSET